MTGLIEGMWLGKVLAKNNINTNNFLGNAIEQWAKLIGKSMRYVVTA